MKYWALSIALVCVYLITGASGLSCLPCELRNCTKPECDFSGYALDECDCCTVCAKQLNETCGGFWNIEGTCDKNLTCNVTSDTPFAGGVCSDAECQATVDFVFALQGSSEWERDFPGAKTWSQNMISKIYEMYGACAHVEVMQFAGIGKERESVYPINLDQCTNNNDCVKRKLEDMSLLGHSGGMTFTTLIEIAEGRFPLSSRYGRAQTVIIFITYGSTVDSEMADAWAISATHTEILTYALRTGASEEELLNITGDSSRIVPTAHDELMAKIWRDTVNTTGQCPPGETYFDCLQDCEPTCENPNPACDGICTGFGCGCTKLHVRHNGVCIPEMECNSTESCGYGEEYHTCSSPCTPTCDDPEPICAEVCEPPKCECKDGYVRINGSCYSMEICPKGNCSYGEELLSCSMNCTRTCDDPRPELCDVTCGAPKCVCKEGYVRNNGTCMPEDTCPKVCPYGEIYRPCAATCEPTCANPHPICIEICRLPGECQCMDGYVRENGKCIPISECSTASNCSYGEEFRRCSSYCTPTCDNPHPSCIAMCGPPRCQCMSGYVRHNGTCIPNEYCPTNVSCEYPKIASSCASKCQPTCDNANPWYCDSGCAQDPCVCPVDHVLLSEYDRRCVHQFECPTKVCSQQCPPIDRCTNARELSRAWICHFQKWRCTSYQWKVSVEEWWYSSGCYAVGGDIEHRWRRLYECPHHVNITCTYQDQYEYDVDAFGCEIGRCRDGYYRDNTQFMKLWMAHQMKYQEKMQLYNEAKSMCGGSLNVEQGCHSGIASHAKPLSSNFLPTISGIAIGMLFSALSL